MEVAAIIPSAVIRAVTFLLLLVVVSAQTRPDAARLADSAHARMAAQNYQEAALDYEALLKLRPGDPEARFALGVCYTQMDRLSEAATELRRTVGR